MADATGLKKINTELVRKALRQGGVMSKNDFARATGLSFPTVSRTVDALVQLGELRQAGAAASTGGRCAQRYERDPRFRVMLCARLEGRRLSYEVRDLDGVVLEQAEQPPSASVLEMLDELAVQVREKYPNLGGAALGVDCSIRSGVVCETMSYHELLGVDLAERLRQAAGVPAAAERDMHLAAAGYCVRQGGWKGVAVCIYLGPSGMGASTVIGGKTFEGASAFAGELHYLPIKNNLEYAKTHFAGADMVAYYMQVIRAYAALVNPARVVLYDNPLLAGKVERIRHACEQTLPAQAVPEIVLSHEFQEDYNAGLFRLANEMTEEKLHELLYF